MVISGLSAALTVIDLVKVLQVLGAFLSFTVTVYTPTAVTLKVTLYSPAVCGIAAAAVVAPPGLV